ncbi:hypothetical protein RIEGSTA812A_PEG_1192 [invertebrate metagenome]|uniref:Uncharacterized protein n=1 Tax=invertebrate metagenome TaxID=1711999 RepID=A0A484H6P4_9ZZZZ
MISIWGCASSEAQSLAGKSNDAIHDMPLGMDEVQCSCKAATVCSFGFTAACQAARWVACAAAG